MRKFGAPLLVCLPYNSLIPKRLPRSRLQLDGCVVPQLWFEFARKMNSSLATPRILQKSLRIVRLKIVPREIFHNLNRTIYNDFSIFHESKTVFWQCRSRIEEFQG